MRRKKCDLRFDNRWEGNCICLLLTCKDRRHRKEYLFSASYEREGSSWMRFDTNTYCCCTYALNFSFSCSDFLLYVSPTFAVLFLPDRLAVHFLHYFIYIRVLHFHEHKEELNDIDQFFNYYYEHLAENYGPKSELCTIHIHSHLRTQVQRHGSLAMTSCFPRESFIGAAIKWCHGKRYTLEQFFTWYRIDRALYPKNRLTLSHLFDFQRFDDKYLNHSIVESFSDKFISCCSQKNPLFDQRSPVKRFARYFRGLKTFHSLAYSRGSNAISYWTSTKNDACPGQKGRCFGEVIYYFPFVDEYYAFVKHHNCIAQSLSDGRSSTPIPPKLAHRLDMYYYFFDDRKFSYQIVPVRSILNKVIRMPWNQSCTSVFTEVQLDWEHDWLRRSILAIIFVRLIDKMKALFKRSATHLVEFGLGIALTFANLFYKIVSFWMILVQVDSMLLRADRSATKQMKPERELYSDH